MTVGVDDEDNSQDEKAHPNGHVAVEKNRRNAAVRNANPRAKLGVRGPFKPLAN